MSDCVDNPKDLDDEEEGEEGDLRAAVYKADMFLILPASLLSYSANQSSVVTEFPGWEGPLGAVSGPLGARRGLVGGGRAQFLTSRVFPEEVMEQTVFNCAQDTPD